MGKRARRSRTTTWLRDSPSMGVRSHVKCTKRFCVIVTGLHQIEGGKDTRGVYAVDVEPRLRPGSSFKAGSVKTDGHTTVTDRGYYVALRIAAKALTRIDRGKSPGKIGKKMGAGEWTPYSQQWGEKDPQYPKGRWPHVDKKGGGKP